MLKEAGGLAGGALIFSPLGVPLLFHGLAGVVIGGAGLFVADAVLKQVVGTASKLIPQSGTRVAGEQNQESKNAV